VRAKPQQNPTPLVTFPAEEPTPTPAPTPSPVPSPSPTAGAGPGPVQNVSAGTIGVPAGSVKVDWDANPPSDDIEHYNIYRQAGSDCSGPFSGSVIAQVTAGAPPTYTDTPPAPDDYCYAVTAVDSGGTEGSILEGESDDKVTVA
jgi:fibronectin type 3 domain-containing protein